MGFFSRFGIVVGTVVSVGVVAIVLQNVGQTIAGQVQNLGPIVLSLLLLAIVVWFIVSTVQEERTVETRRRRR